MNRALCLITLCFLLNSCAFYSLAKPIEPKAGFPRILSKVDSLQPELKWKPKFEGPYDLIVLEATKNDFMFNRKGKIFYEAQNQVGTSHKIQKQLHYDMIYHWAVRKHSEQSDSRWSDYKYFIFYGVGYAYYWNQFFGFKTLREGQLEKLNKSEQ